MECTLAKNRPFDLIRVNQLKDFLHKLQYYQSKGRVGSKLLRSYCLSIIFRTVERGEVGGVGGPGPAKIAFYNRIEHNFEIDYFVFFIILKNHYTVSVSVKIKSSSFFRSLGTMAH